MGRKISMKEKKIFLLLTDTDTMLTRLIRACTKTPYNHASIGFNPELSEVYSFGRKTVYNPFIGGFVREDMHSVLFQQADCSLYSLTVTDHQFEKMHSYIRVMDIQKECLSLQFYRIIWCTVEETHRQEEGLLLFPVCSYCSKGRPDYGR